MISLEEITELRLQNILTTDKNLHPKKILPLLKSDISNLLKNYFNLTYFDVNLDVANCKIILKVEAEANRIRNIGKFI